MNDFTLSFWLILEPNLKGASPYHYDKMKLSNDFVHLVYELILTRYTDWKRLNYYKKNVLEIGAGPLLGFAPLAIYLGCEQYTCIEPGYDSVVMSNDRIIYHYFLPLYKDLLAIYGYKLSFDDYVDKYNAPQNLDH